MVNNATRFTVAIYQVKRKDLKRVPEMMVEAIKNPLFLPFKNNVIRDGELLEVNGQSVASKLFSNPESELLRTLAEAEDDVKCGRTSSMQDSLDDLRLSLSLGNYTKEHHEWLDGIDIEKIVKQAGVRRES